jgi:transcriptional regulator with XRE-family HTH domain
MVGELMREARESRFGYGLSQDDVARAIGMSRSRYSRIERGLVPTVSLVTAAEMLAVVGLDLSVRTYPSGEPIRDAAHAALLERLRRLLHGSLRWRTEVPLPDPRERRAWDAVVSGRDAIGLWQMGVEAETRPRDLQALERRLALKERDGGVDAVHPAQPKPCAGPLVAARPLLEYAAADAGPPRGRRATRRRRDRPRLTGRACV